MEESKEELETSEVDQLRRLSVIADGVPVIQYSVLWKVSPISARPNVSEEFSSRGGASNQVPSPNLCNRGFT